MPFLHIDLPIRIIVPRKTMKDKLWSCNFNQYRNCNKFYLGQLKKLFYEQIKHKLPKPGEIKFHQPTITYKFFYDTKRNTDLMNWVAVIDKFFLDILVKENIIEDDNIHHVQNYAIYFGGFDKKNPRIEAMLSE